MNGQNSGQSGVVTKVCVNKFCHQTDITDFSTCRYCGTRYDGKAEREVYKPTPLERIMDNPLQAILTVIFGGSVLLAVGASLLGYSTGMGSGSRRGGIPAIPGAFIAYVGGHMATNANNNVQNLNRVLEKDPTNYDALISRGDSHYTRLEMSEALNDYTAAVAAQPDRRAAYEKRAVIYDAMGSYNLSKKDRDTAAFSCQH